MKLENYDLQKWQYYLHLRCTQNLLQTKSTRTVTRIWGATYITVMPWQLVIQNSIIMILLQRPARPSTKVVATTHESHNIHCWKRDDIQWTICQIDSEETWSSWSNIPTIPYAWILKKFPQRTVPNKDYKTLLKEANQQWRLGGPHSQDNLKQINS